MRQVGIPFGKHKHVVVEDLQVLRYEVDQHYHTHHDYFDPKMHHGFLQVPCLILVRISYLPGGVILSPQSGPLARQASVPMFQGLGLTKEQTACSGLVKAMCVL